ncbi:MAG: PAS domain-containing protein [Proteobacteria bacterium]|nr:PAS domain-containing protein [Pseudomonadota bacterium]
MAPNDGAATCPIDPTTGDPVPASTVIPPGDFPVGMLPIDHPQLAQLYRYWDRKRGDRAMPARRDILPEELSGLIGNLFMVDVVRDDGYTRFRYRVVGGALTAVMDQELTGKFIDQMPFLFRKFALPAYREILRVGRPTYKQTNAFEGWLVIRYKRLLLPLSSDGNQIDIVMGGIYQF